MTLRELVQAWMDGDRYVAHDEPGQYATATTERLAAEGLGKPIEYFQQYAGGGSIDKIPAYIAMTVAGQWPFKKDDRVCAENLPQIGELSLSQLVVLGRAVGQEIETLKAEGKTDG